MKIKIFSIFLILLLFFLPINTFSHEFQANDGIHKLEGKLKGFDVKTNKTYIIDKSGKTRFIHGSKLSLQDLTYLADFYGKRLHKIEDFTEKSSNFQMGDWTTVIAKHTIVLAINKFKPNSVTIVYLPPGSDVKEDLHIRNVDTTKLKIGRKLPEDLKVYFEKNFTFDNRYGQRVTLLSGIVDYDIGVLFDEFVEEEKNK